MDLLLLIASVLVLLAAARHALLAEAQAVRPVAVYIVLRFIRAA